jgi:hypothetical protein
MKSIHIMVATHCEPQRKLSFTMKADPDFIPHTAFDEHIIVGGRFYDILDGTSYSAPPESDTPGKAGGL